MGAQNFATGSMNDLARCRTFWPHLRDDRGIVAIGHKADVLAVRLVGDVKAKLGSGPPHGRLLQSAEREAQEVELLAGGGEQKPALIARRVDRAVQLCAACARLAPQGMSMAALAPEPRFTNAPTPSEIAPQFFEQQAEDDRIDELQARMDALDAQIINLRKVLDVLGPLPNHPEIFIPVMLSEIEKPMSEAEAAHRYSPVLRGTEADMARFHRIELASYPAQAEAEARWNELAAAGTLTRSRPGYDRIESGICLDGRISEDDAVNALCVKLSAIAGPARVARPIRASW